MSGIVAQPVGITSPPIDDLLEHVDSKYALVIFAAKRARQINSYNLQLQQNMIQFVGPRRRRPARREAAGRVSA